MKKRPGILEEIKQSRAQLIKPFDREEWERKHGPLFDDETMDSFLEAIWESKGKKLPDYLRRVKK